VILSTILQTSINRAHALHILAPKHLIHFSSSVSLTFGILIIFLSRVIYYATTRSYYMTIVSLIGAAIFHTLKGEVFIFFCPVEQVDKN
ncbi:hypothetical protein, partial [Bacillus nitratireducens]|uniref:hypothetical protein n=1 Tax=Bacillus nitratireducens TaxID=2026193 RepID=UPI00284CE431